MRETLKYSGGVNKYGKETFKEEVTDFLSKQGEMDKMHANLETNMANIRIKDGLKKMSITDVIHDGDAIFSDNFSPWASFAREAIHDQSLPEEFRKMLSAPRTERMSMRSKSVD